MTTDGDILQKRKRSRPQIISVENKKLLATISKKTRAGVAHSANLEEETLLQMEPIYSDSDTPNNGIDVERRSESGRLHQNSQSSNKSHQFTELESEITSMCETQNQHCVVLRIFLFSNDL